MIFQQVIHKMASNPRILFLMDSFGALVSTFSLGVILVKFDYLFGMPKNVLYILSAIAGVFVIYSFFCYLKIPKNWRLFLKIIAIANALYCVVSMGIVFYFYRQLTTLGFIYFLLEFAVLIFLINFELKVANKQFIQ